MVKIKAVIEVYEDEIRAEAGVDDLADAIRQELGWLHDSGMSVETWDYVDRPSRFPKEESTTAIRHIPLGEEPCQSCDMMMKGICPYAGESEDKWNIPDRRYSGRAHPLF